MDIKSAEESFQDVTYGDDEYSQLLEHLEQEPGEEGYHLCLLIGKRDDRKEEALQQISDRVNREIYSVDANDLISKTESETYENIDRVFDKFDAGNTLFHLGNASRLCGTYMGHSQSVVRYATPPERHFLTKMQEKGGFFIADIAVAQDTDNTLRRAAQSIVNFPKPQSGFQKFMWRIKQIGVHGHEIKTERPEHYGNQSGNF